MTPNQLPIIKIADGLVVYTDILVGLHPQEYERRLPAVRENFIRARGFFCREDLLCEYSDQPDW